jgi:transcription antitermination factor NusG
MLINTTNKWFALYTKPRAEKKVYENLKAKGIEVYLPVRKVLQQWSDRKKWVDIPLINSYIFVYITKSDYVNVLETQGVVMFVYNKKRGVATISDTEMQIMKRAVDSKLQLNIEPTNIQKGQTVTITTGPLKGLTGEVMNINGNKKLYLNIVELGYSLVIALGDIEVG